MRGPEVRPIVIAAGGTGGHFFPAEALAAALIARGHRIVLMTDQRAAARLDQPGAAGSFAGRERHVLPGAGIAGRGPWRGLRAGLALCAGTLRARRLLTRLNAAAVVGFGGYPSVPPILAASLLRARPVSVLHEQNAVLGRANRWLARRADVLALGFAGTARLPAGVPAVVTGNPVRPAIMTLAAHPYTPFAAHPDATPDDRIALFVVGGSLGARVFSDVVPAALALLPAKLRARLSVTQQCRAEDLDRVRAAYAASGIAATLAPFFNDIAAQLAHAHLVIARAGASTVAELAVAGRPAILVPLPGAIDAHQTAKARALAAGGGAVIIAQPACTPDGLAERVGALLADPAALARAAASAAAQGRADAAARLADLVETRIARARPAAAAQETRA